MQSTSTSISNTRDSGSLFSGLPSIVSHAERMVQNYPEILEAVLAEIKAEEEDALRQSMQEHPDWSQHVDKASVEFKDGSVVYRSSGDTASDLEYGNPVSNIAPTGLLRSTAQRRSYDVATNFSRKFSEKMGDLR